ncbi:MAG TPA: DUF2007 domain-containing protein [Moheibacter sp.]|nr:DUF2007 domain-containing protein [Moheibacter sp.]
MNTKLIAKYNQSHLAHIHKGLLEENGIKAFIFGNNFMSVVPNLSGILDAGIELRVKEEDYDTAIKILEFQEKEKILCANCNSENIVFSYGKKGTREILVSLFSALIGEPFGNIKRHYYCNDCGFKNKN